MGSVAGAGNLPAANQRALGPLSCVATAAATGPKALGPLSGEVVIKSATTQKALGPLAVPEPDILGRWRSLG